jgi:hypothetical protein
VGVTVDTSQLDRLTADLANAPKAAGPNIRKAFIVSSARIKREWQQKLSGTPGVPHGALTITYDISVGATGVLGDVIRAFDIGGGALANQIVSEIGAEDGRSQAPIVAVLEYGSPVNNLPPHGYGTAALADNTDDFTNGLLLAIGDPLGKTGAAPARAVPESSLTEAR